MNIFHCLFLVLLSVLAGILLWTELVGKKLMNLLDLTRTSLNRSFELFDALYEKYKRELRISYALQQLARCENCKVKCCGKAVICSEECIERLIVAYDVDEKLGTYTGDTNVSDSK